MKEIIIITNYYPPEIGAASNRIFHLAEGLQKHSFNVSILTPLPNYPKGKIFKEYKGRFKVVSIENDIKIHRLWIYASNSKNIILRLISMLSYSFSLAWYFTWHKIPKTVIIQSPPLLVAFTSLLFLNSKKHELILNVSDLWPIAGLELGAFKKNLNYRLLEKIEHFNYNKAHLILGQSEEILSHVDGLFPKKNTLLYRNYPDFEVTQGEVNDNHPTNKIKLVYAGLLGMAQGIYRLCTELDYSKIEFHIYGSGTEQHLIEDFISKNPSLPIFFYGEKSRIELHKLLFQYDLTIIPLLKRIYGSVPSKIFEYARLGLPIIYFGGGEGEGIIKNHKLGWSVVPENYGQLNALLNSFGKEQFNSSSKLAILKTAFDYFSFESQLKSLIDKL